MTEFNTHVVKERKRTNVRMTHNKTSPNLLLATSGREDSRGLIGRMKETSPMKWA